MIITQNTSKQLSRNKLAPQKICLGSANFGLNYGIKNNQKILTEHEVKKLLTTANVLGIQSIDSAFSYGCAHARLNKLGGLDFRLITKVNYSELKNSVDFRLCLDSISSCRDISLLLHDSDFLTKADLNDGLKNLSSLKRDGMIKKFGLSIYRPETLDLVDDCNSYDIVQYPFNVFDRRMETTGWMRKLRIRGVEQFARSIFMQGMLLMDVDKLPSYFYRWSGLFEQWAGYLCETQQTAVQASINYVLHRAEIDKIVIGADSSDQLNEIMSICSNPDMEPFNYSEISDEDLIEPFRWKIN